MHTSVSSWSKVPLLSIWSVRAKVAETTRMWGFAIVYADPYNVLAHYFHAVRYKYIFRYLQVGTTVDHLMQRGQAASNNWLDIATIVYYSWNLSSQSNKTNWFVGTIWNRFDFSITACEDDVRVPVLDISFKMHVNSDHQLWIAVVCPVVIGDSSPSSVCTVAWIMFVNACVPVFISWFYLKKTSI